MVEVTPHAPIDDDEDEEQDEEFDEDEPPRSLKRHNAGMDLRCSEAWEQEEDRDAMAQPDLGEYFGQWEMPASSEIALCRTYANYLASKMKAASKTK